MKTQKGDPQIQDPQPQDKIAMAAHAVYWFICHDEVPRIIDHVNEMITFATMHEYYDDQEIRIHTLYSHRLLSELLHNINKIDTKDLKPFLPFSNINE